MRKAGLHKHDQKARDQGPGEIDTDLVLPNLIGNICNSNADLRIRGGNVIDGARECPARVSLLQCSCCRARPLPRL